MRRCSNVPRGNGTGLTGTNVHAAARGGFSLIEILIVIIIMSIIAVIVIPKYVEASKEAAEAALAKDLRMLREQIEVFKLQHNGILPGQDNIKMYKQLTGKTDIDGTLNASGAFGPYMRIFPTNPFTDTNTVKQADSGSPGATGQAWFYNTTIGLFAPNDNAHSGL